MIFFEPLHINKTTVFGISDKEILTPAIFSNSLASGDVVSPHLIVVPQLSDAEQLVMELRSVFKLSNVSIEVLFCPESIGFKANDFFAMSENQAQRCRVMNELLRGNPCVVVASAGAVYSPVISTESFKTQTMVLKVGDTGVEPHDLAKTLLSIDYDNEFEVHVPGEFSLRGGIVDLFSPACKFPARIDFFGDEIDSIRFFDPSNQRSVESVSEVLVIPRSDIAEASSTTLIDYLELGEGRMTTVHPDLIKNHFDNFLGGIDLPYQVYDKNNFIIYSEEENKSDYTLKVYPLTDLVKPAKGLAFYQQVEKDILRGLLDQWSDRYTVYCAFKDETTFEFVKELSNKKSRLVKLDRPLVRGFIAPEAGVVVLTDAEIQPSIQSEERRRLAAEVRDYHSDWTIRDDIDLEVGDIVVHVQYGISEYHGIKEIDDDGQRQEVLELEFAEEVRIYVPMNQAHLVSRYVGQGGGSPKLSKVGGTSWKRKKATAEDAVRDFASELLRIQAARTTVEGIESLPDDELQKAFENTFPFTPTPDQFKAFEEVKADMERKQPMDRLLCGDVGYGKTEVAMRAAFKAVMNGYQVAVITPTTILAQQHFDSFSERMQNFPVMLDFVCRFRPAKDQKLALKRAASGDVDIIVGTHRLLQKDVKFRNLGLVIIDEEQKFGVKHKEFLKQLRVSVDVLTMSATPIPRTLYMSLTGARDLSTINTPPGQRQAVKNIVGGFDEELLREAIMREMERGGQVFVLHNRVKSIHGFAEKIQGLAPKARIIVGHGQMESSKLEDVMHAFQRHKYDILVCTTIIENGVDVPNANTIIIDRADRFGLAELYQIRGRVGRSHRQAYAYLIVPPTGIMTTTARERIAAIKKYTHLGAGFKLALRDLEIRGSGNILGVNQSGYIAAIGFELYCELLRDTVNRLKNLPPEKSSLSKQCFVNLGFIRYQSYDPQRDKEEGVLSASIPSFYINAENLRLECYRRLARLKSEVELESFVDELRDRFGRLPQPVLNLIELTRIIILADEANIHSLVLRHDYRLFLETPRGNVKIAGRIPVIEPSTPQKMLKGLMSLLRSL